LKYLVAVREASHTAHHTKNVVIHGIHANLSSVGALNGGVGENKLKGSVVNTREVARAGRLVLLGSQCERIQVDTGIGGAGVVLVRLNQVEVGSLTLREAVLAVKLELSSHDGILTPAVHVKRGLGKNKSAGIRNTGGGSRMSKVGQVVVCRSRSIVSELPPRSATGSSILSGGISEKTGGVDVSVSSSVNNGVVGSEGHNGVG